MNFWNVGPSGNKVAAAGYTAQMVNAFATFDVLSKAELLLLIENSLFYQRNSPAGVTK